MDSTKKCVSGVNYGGSAFLWASFAVFKADLLLFFCGFAFLKAEPSLWEGERGNCGDRRNREGLPSGFAPCWRLQVAVSHLLGDLVGECSWRFFEQGGASRALFRPGRGPVASSLKIARIVVRVCGVVVGCRFPSSFFFLGVRGYCQRVPVACRRRIVCCSVCIHVHFGGPSFVRHRRSVQAQVSLCDVIRDRGGQKAGNEPKPLRLPSRCAFRVEPRKTGLRSGLVSRQGSIWDSTVWCWKR